MKEKVVFVKSSTHLYRYKESWDDLIKRQEAYMEAMKEFYDNKGNPC